MRRRAGPLARPLPRLRRLRDARRAGAGVRGARSGARRKGAAAGVVVPLAVGRDERRDPHRDRHRASSTACSAAALVPGSLVLLGGEPGVGKSSLTAAMLGAHRRASGRCCSWPARSRRRRCACAPSASARPPASACSPRPSSTPSARRSRPRRPTVCVVDSVQTLWDERARLGARVGRAGARGRRAAAARGQGAATSAIVLVGHVTKEGASPGRACSSTSSTSC